MLIEMQGTAGGMDLVKGRLLAQTPFPSRQSTMVFPV